MSGNMPTLSAEDQYRLIARDEANKLLMNHLQLCPLIKAGTEKRLRSLETGFAKLTGFMIGSGLLGGGVGGAISSWLN